MSLLTRVTLEIIAEQKQRYGFALLQLRPAGNLFSENVKLAKEEGLGFAKKLLSGEAEVVPSQHSYRNTALAQGAGRRFKTYKETDHWWRSGRVDGTDISFVYPRMEDGDDVSRAGKYTIYLTDEENQAQNDCVAAGEKATPKIVLLGDCRKGFILPYGTIKGWVISEEWRDNSATGRVGLKVFIKLHREGHFERLVNPISANANFQEVSPEKLGDQAGNKDKFLAGGDIRKTNPIRRLHFWCSEELRGKGRADKTIGIDTRGQEWFAPGLLIGCLLRFCANMLEEGQIGYSTLDENSHAQLVVSRTDKSLKIQKVEGETKTLVVETGLRGLAPIRDLNFLGFASGKGGLGFYNPIGYDARCDVTFYLDSQSWKDEILGGIFDDDVNEEDK